MTPTGTGPQPPEPPDSPTFAGLIDELRELGFEPVCEHPDPVHTQYAAPDSPVLVTIIDGPEREAVWVSVRSAGEDSWGLDWSGTTPHPVQLIALYAALNDDPAAAIAAAAAALGVPPPTSPAKPFPTAG